AAATAAKTEDTGVVYEKSDEGTAAVTSTSTKSVDHEAIVAKLKADAEKQTANLRSIVEKLMLGQSKASSIAENGVIGGDKPLTDGDMWSFLASGDFTVDAATKAQAEADVAEDGYWGVEKTSDRILDFAKALAGNDPSKASELLDAFKEGYKQATATWGKELPDISAKTYEAVEQKFNDWMNEAQNPVVES
nr:hypothetical protein [Lachnospiraceae bacterium]